MVVRTYISTMLRRLQRTLTKSGKRAGAEVKVHHLTEEPTRAWETINNSQTVIQVTQMPHDTQISSKELRIVCVSDTHVLVEDVPNFIPPGDILIHAGDFGHGGAPVQVKRFNDFLGTLPHSVKIVIAGNHDQMFDERIVRHKGFVCQLIFLTETELDTQLQNYGVQSCRDILTECVYLEDSSIKICGVNFYGSPWQPKHGRVPGAFRYERGQQGLDIWNKIPNETDILITHGPPLGYGVTTDRKTTYINASSVDRWYSDLNKPIVFDFPIPKGHSKEELAHVKPCHLIRNKVRRFPAD
ncbi:metallophosphoesterase domain-containing protein 1-like isoform X2 [Mya arenaria]|uniref:metallophosphoesterase domain-containing protein 1-like isoform X2 n=1 Tax=Mya arenaria TaxID=6604 RepID=UPI0022E45AA7|nr:metallophosphoesterase domain-containing protein 1-like isoform X2 [Mya arenaria]